MRKPNLVIMAAGMGSRYGGLKQIDPIDDKGHILMDFSIYDAVRAGFGKVIFVIKKENEADFRGQIGRRVEKRVETAYAYQRLDDLPAGFSVPEGRVKPFGTGQAVLAAADQIDAPFVVINADDYYGADAYRQMFSYLTQAQEGDAGKGAPYRMAMAGYLLENTLTEHGYVSRGICSVDENGCLTGICERTRIEQRGGGVAYTEDEGKTWVSLPKGAIASMNFWGFPLSFLGKLREGFARFLAEDLPKNPLKAEFFLPFAVDGLIGAGKATVQVLKTEERWYGVTYREDKPAVVRAMRARKEAGAYPEELWA